MPKLLKVLLTGWLAIMTASSALAGAHYQIKTTASDFDAALFNLENAIVNRGLVVDSVGHVGTMLARTSKATGGSSPYIGARYLAFCSAKLSVAAMQVDPDNLAICPYVMFVYELKSEPGKARIGYRRPMAVESAASKDAIAAIDKLLAGILDDATH